MEVKKALLITGSQKPAGGTSASLSGFLMKRLVVYGVTTRSLDAMRCIDGGKNSGGQMHIELLNAVKRADMIIPIFPLYCDTVPYCITRVFEIIHAQYVGRVGRAAGGARRSKRLMAIVNSGFPESSQCDTAVRVCRRFSKEAGLEFWGALKFGGGAMLGDTPLEEVGSWAMSIMRSLDLAAESIAFGDPLPYEATALAARLAVPKWGYVTMGNLGMTIEAAKNGALWRIFDRPADGVEGVKIG